LAGSERPGDLLRSVENAREIGKIPNAQRRWDANNDRVTFREPRKIATAFKAFVPDQLGDAFLGNVANMRAAGVQQNDALGVDIESEYLGKNRSELDCERKTDVAETDDADRGGPRGETPNELINVY